MTAEPDPWELLRARLIRTRPAADPARIIAEAAPSRLVGPDRQKFALLIARAMMLKQEVPS